MPVTDRPILDADYPRTRELLASFEQRGGPLTWWGLDRLDSLCFPGYREAVGGRLTGGRPTPPRRPARPAGRRARTRGP